MVAVVTSKTQDSITLEITVPLAKSMLKSEENITNALNEAGCLAAEVALEQFDTDGSPIMMGDVKWT
ncbi:MAG: ISKra4 family transposase, partial [Exilibacterium sp.]